MMTPESHPQRLRVAHLNPNTQTAFHLRPDETVRTAMAADLSLAALSRLDFRGTLRGHGDDGWLLKGNLTARVTQPCVVTLKPVRTIIDEPVRIEFTPHAATPEGDEAEMPDESVEPLGNFIDLTAIMVEALSLALPAYPRIEGAALPQSLAPAEEIVDTRKPFAGLDKLLVDKGRES